MLYHLGNWESQTSSDLLLRYNSRRWNKTLSSIISYWILEVTQTCESWFEFVLRDRLVLNSFLLWVPKGLEAKEDKQDEAECALKAFRAETPGELIDKIVNALKIFLHNRKCKCWIHKMMLCIVLNVYYKRQNDHCNITEAFILWFSVFFLC